MVKHSCVLAISFETNFLDGTNVWRKSHCPPPVVETNQPFFSMNDLGICDVMPALARPSCLTDVTRLSDGGGCLAQRTLCDFHKSLSLWPTNSNTREPRWSSENASRSCERSDVQCGSLYVQLFSITCTCYVLSHVPSQSSAQHLLLLHVAIFESRRCLSL